MKISLNWLKDFVDIKNTSQELADLLSAKLTEVGGYTDQAQKYAGIICVRVDELKHHPNSYHLWLVKVFDGVGERHIVCGAQNLAVGQIVPLITVGSRVPSTNEEIVEVTIRGQKSAGMLASGRELSLNDDHSGIYTLDQSINPGTAFSDALGLNDVILEIENKALTHRGDCFSHLGIAREVAAITNQKLKPTKTPFPTTSKSGGLSIHIEDKKDCPRYQAAYVKNAKIGPSPTYIQDRLRACGMRPINNLVDFTNYVMLETGQPLHAFDAAKLSTGPLFKLGVRRARRGEALTTLDGKQQTLTTDNLAITSNGEPAAVAGVMGGASSEISQETTAVVLEAANFDHYAVRRSSRVLGLRTEASLRYEKNLDPGLVEQGMARILQLITENKVGEIVTIVDEYPQPLKPGTIEISEEFILTRLGVPLSLDKAADILTRLGLTTSGQARGRLTVSIPTFRRDLNIPEDLIEELARIYGYEKITQQLPLRDLTPVRLTTYQEWERGLREFLKQLGYSEVYSYYFVGKEGDDQLEITNPLSPDLKYIRNSLISGLLAKVDYNRHNFDLVKLFEIGKEIHKTSPKTLPEERLVLAAAFYDKMSTDPEKLFRRAKGDLEAVLAKFNAVTNDGIASIRLVNDQTVIFELPLAKLFALTASTPRTIQEVPRFPPVIEDLSFFINPNTKVGDVIADIKSVSPWIVKIEVFDIYKEEGKKSVALRLTYQSNLGPLSDAEVAPLRLAIIKRLEKTHHLVVRWCCG